MQFLNNIYLRLLSVSGVLWICSVLLLLLSNNTGVLEKTVERLGAELNEAKLEMDATLEKNKSIINNILDENYEYDDFEVLNNQEFILYIFDDENLIFWNDNSINLTRNLVDKWENETYQKLNNGYYYYVDYTPYNLRNKNNLKFVVLFLIRYSFDNASNNKNLVDYDNENFTIPDNLQFLDYTPQSQVERINVNKNKKSGAIYAVFESTNSAKKSYWLIFAFQFVSVLLLIYTAYSFSVTLSERKQNEAFILFVSFIFFLLFLIFSFEFPLNFSKIPIFFRHLSADIEISIGKLILFLFLVFLVLLYFYRHFKTNGFINLKEPNSVILYGIYCFIFTLFNLLILRILGLIVASNDTAYMLENLLLFDAFAYLGVIAVLFKIAIIFYSCRIFLKVVRETKFDFLKRIIAVFCALSPFAFLQLSSLSSIELNFALFVSLVVCLGAAIFKYPVIKFWRLQHIFSIIICSAFLSTLFIVLIKNKVVNQERLDFIEKLSQDEYISFSPKELGNLNLKIRSDKTYDEYLSKPFLSYKSLERLILNKYFDSETINDYNPIVQIFDKNDKAQIIDSPIQSRSDLIQLLKSSELTDFDHFYKLDDDSGIMKYCSVIDVSDDVNLKLGTIVIQFSVEAVKEVTDATTVSLNDEFQDDSPYSKFEYAVYVDSILIDQSENFSYSNSLKIFTKNFIEKNDTLVNFGKDGYNHIYYNPTSSEKIIVVSKPNNFIRKILSVFSILFFVFIVSTVFAIVFVSFLRPKENLARAIFYSSFRKKISTSLFAIILFSFILVGLATSIYFSSNFNTNYESKLSSKRSEIATSIQQVLNNESVNDVIQKRNSIELKAYVDKLTKMHNVDINLFDINGNLLVSSKPSLLADGYIGSQMNASAFQKFKKLEKRIFINKERIGILDYKASYGIIQNRYNREIAFLQIPNYESTKEVTSNIANFLSTILNAYVIILLLSSLLAFLLARSLTKPIQLIGQKINNIRLGQKNDELLWNDDDEIGELVSKYNQAVKKLETSAKSLAESERQIAYEQMAKQISHEVRNPLTPMKLSIQQLQRVSENNDPMLKTHVKRMCNTLIEQIDHLERVASEFSFFARVKNEKKELLDLLSMLNSVIFLYKETRAVKIVKIFPDQTCWVYADRTQLTKVFHNILKNAMQAVKNKEQGVIFVNVKIEGVQAVEISFTDNGVGISPEGVSKVFTPNFTTKTAGMGLGLAICKNIIEDLEGDIWLTSELGEGTTFYIKLPLKR